MKERKYLAISIKHTEWKWKFGKPCVLWGWHQTKDDEKYESKESSKTVSIEFTEPNISTDEEPIFTTIDKQVPKITVKTKTKKKINKNYHLEGQIDFTNLI